jgi:TolB-like protein
MAAGETLRVGDVVLDLGAGCLRGADGAEIALRPKSFDLLAELARNPRRTLSRDELLDAVWPGLVVTEESVTQCVGEVRRAIGDAEGRLLRTVARRGYRLDVEVVLITPDRDRVTAAPTGAERSVPSPVPGGAQLDKPTIAVLPFQNMSGDPEQEYFVDGMVEDIITGLSRIKWLFVIARNSTFVYKAQAVDVKQVGRDLGVRYVLKGSVRKLGNRVRITAQLIDATSAAHVWAERYDRALDDIFALQDELTLSVIGAIEPSLRRVEIERARRKRPDSLDAWDLYLRALPFAATAMPEDADKALLLLEQAIALEPDYAVVHAMIAWCHEQRYLRGGMLAETRAAASRHARAAIAAGGDDAPALAMAGFVIGVVEHDYETALYALDRSLALSPSSALALGFGSIIRAWTGADATSIAHAETAIRLSPYDPLIYLPYLGLAYAYFFTGRLEESLTAAGRAAQANPRFSVPAVFQTAVLASLGRVDAAAASARHLLELEPGFRISQIASLSSNKARLAMLAEALRQAGLPE